MARKAKYTRYDSRLKAVISRTGRIDLFPNLEIPEMTARYWAQKQYNIDDPILLGMADALNDAKFELEQLKQQLAEKCELVKLFKSVSSALGLSLKAKLIESSETKIEILAAIAEAMKNVSRATCLQELGISLSRYKRWRRETRGCGLLGRTACPRGFVTQLSSREIQVMRNMVTSEKYAHFPIRALHLYAKRKGFLFCAYSSWLKYIRHFGWARPRKALRRKITRIGIRAKGPNEIWHLDVSYFIFPNRTRAFIQAIIDNYSRYVVGWQILDSYDGSKTGELVKRALENRQRQLNRGGLRLIVDGGGENKGKAMAKLEGEGHFRKEVAKFQISFSNSMVEALFRSLKHNYLFHQKITTKDSLAKHASFWFREHNERVPHAAFEGQTPGEMFRSSWPPEASLRILVNQEKALKLRIEENQRVFCEQCEDIS